MPRVLALVPSSVRVLALVLFGLVAGRPAAGTSADDGPIGFWRGAFVRMDSVLPVHVWIESDETGATAAYTEIPDWIWYGRMGPEPVTRDDEGRVVLETAYGRAVLVRDPEYREMIGPVGSTTPSTTLHLKRAVPPPASTSAEREIAFASDVPLEGTLVLPEGDGPFPCVLMLHGRGCGGRAAHVAQGRFLARYGLATFGFDQRGAPAARGPADVDCDSTTFPQVVADAEAAWRALLAEPAVDPERIVLRGVSAGAWTAQALAGRALEDPALPRPAAIVTWIGPTTGTVEQQRDAGLAIATRLDLDEERIAMVMRQVDLAIADLADDAAEAAALEELARIEAIARAEGWFGAMFGPDDLPGAERGVESIWLRRFRFDPAPVLRRLADVPYLAVFGAEDDVVPLPKHADRLRTLLAEAGNDDVRVVIVRGVGHGVEHGDRVRRLIGPSGPSSYFKFDRVEPRFVEATLTFLRDLGLVAR